MSGTEILCGLWYFCSAPSQTANNDCPWALYRCWPLTFEGRGWEGALIDRVLIKSWRLFATGTTTVIITGVLQQILTFNETTTTQRTFCFAVKVLFVCLFICFQATPTVIFHDKKNFLFCYLRVTPGPTPFNQFQKFELQTCYMFASLSLCYALFLEVS